MKLRLIHIALLLLTLVGQTKADNMGFTKIDPLLFGLDNNYPPLQFLDENGTPSGLDVEFTKVLLNRLDIPFTYAPNTWSNIASDILSGRVDLGMMVYSTYRKDSAYFSHAVFRMYYQMVIRKSDESTFDMRNLTGKTIAYMMSRPVNDTLTKAGAIPHVVTDLTSTFIDLSEGKYDGLICFRHQARFIAEKNGLHNLAYEDVTLTPREYCYVSKNKELIDAINKELDKMEVEGIIADTYGIDVISKFGSNEVPIWMWYLLAALVFVLLITVLVMQSISNKKLRKEMERAQHSEQLKTIFLSNVSHALRTPLNAIIGFSDVMMTDTDGLMPNEERTQLLGLINKNGLSLLHFINELLELSDIEGNTNIYERGVTDLKDEMSAYAREIKMQLNKYVDLELIGPKEDLRAYLDPKLLRLVTIHLLTNASQHTYQGKVTLEYAARDNGLYVSVTDTGEGLPDGLRENIFALLSDANTYKRDEYPGLGLNICKSIIVKSGGKIGAESPQQGGTRIWYWVPVKFV